MFLDRRGQSLIELIIGMAIFMLIVSAMSVLSVGSFVGSNQSADFVEAESLAREAEEAVHAINFRSWNEIDLSQSIAVPSSTGWVFGNEGATETIGKFTRKIEFSDICRNSSKDIVTCPGTYTDPHTKEVMVTVSWTSSQDKLNEIEHSFLLSNWESRDWTQTNWFGGSGQNIWTDITKYQTATNTDHSFSGELRIAQSATGTGQWSVASGKTFEDETNTDFSQGTLSSTQIVGTGQAGAINLGQGFYWAKSTQSGIITSQDLLGVFRVSSSSAWTIAKDGSIYRFNGTSWVNDSSSASKALYGIYMVSSTNGWAVGTKGLLLRYTGTWSTVSAPTTKDLNSIYMVSSTDGWAVGGAGAIIRYNGSTWSNVTSPTTKNLQSIYMVSSTYGWSVGDTGAIIFYNGVSWSTVTSPTAQNLDEVRVIDSTHAWAVGAAGTILFYNGVSWSTVTSPTAQSFTALSMVSSTFGWAGTSLGTVVVYNGTSWSNYSVLTGTPAIYSMHAIDIDGWLVGQAGLIYRYNYYYVPTGTFYSRVFDAEATSTWDILSWSELLTTGSDVTLATRSGNTSTPDGTWSSFSAEFTDPLGASITSPAARYIQYRITLTAGTNREETPSVDTVDINYDTITSQNINGVNFVSSTFGFAVGANGVILKYGSTSGSPIWQIATTTVTANTLNDVEMLSDTDGWAVGAGGTILKYNGLNWSIFSSPTANTLNAISMVSASEGYIVGEGGVILKFDGVSWASQTSPTTKGLYTVDIVSSTNGWAAGESGTILSYNGASWSTATSPTTKDINYIFMLSSAEGWAVGATGFILYYNGVNWSTATSPTSKNLNAVYMLSPSSGWAVGVDGTILRYDGVSWAAYTSPVIAYLNDIYMNSDLDGWIVGDTGTILTFLSGQFYETAGVLSSSAFDMGGSSPVQVIEWDSIIPSCSPSCEIKTQIRTAPDNGGSPGMWTSWYGASGPDTYFTLNTGTVITKILNNNRWVQYKVFLSGDGYDSPRLEEIRVNYK